MINEFSAKGYDVTIATRSTTPDKYGDKLKRIVIERTNESFIVKKMTFRK